MDIQYEFLITDNLLRVKASGRAESLEEVHRFGMAIVDAVRAHGSARVLCDETELEYALNTFDIFASAEFIAEHASKVTRVAIVCQPRQIEDGKFWETVARNRGLGVRFFKNIAGAEAWLGLSSDQPDAV